jgi:hypothetical protein
MLNLPFLWLNIAIQKYMNRSFTVVETGRETLKLQHGEKTFGILPGKGK